jgi:hypothetical protein
MKTANPAQVHRLGRAIAGLGFLLLFPGFFYYHTLLGTGATGAFLGGYFTPVSLVFLLPQIALYVYTVQRDPHRLASVDIYFGVFLLYFAVIVAVNGINGANPAIIVNHLLGMMFLVGTFIQFKFIDFSGKVFYPLALVCLLAMSAIVFIFSVDGVFYLGALGIARDADSLATYQGFSRSYLMTFLVVITYTRLLSLRLVLYGLGAASLFLNTARSEFVALLFAMPIIEFYHSRQKLYFVLALAMLFALIYMNLDLILTELPNNRILELLDLSRSTSANKRHHLSVHAMQTIAAYPILGDYASYAPGYYSHNILSAWVDLGLFGFIYVMAMLILPAIPMFIKEFFAGRNCSDFILAFSLVCVTVLLLLSSHYFTDMLIGATVGAYSKYRYGKKHVQHRAPHLSASAV